MISPEVHRKVELIRILTKEKVTSSFAGNYLSAFKGSGIEFDGVREYELGDDVRLIDWNVTARTSKPHIKQYREERELTVLFAVDVSSSGDFGSGDKTKKELAAEIVSVLALAAAKNNDKTSLLLFSDQVEEFIPPAKGVEHNYRLVSTLLSATPKSHSTSLVNAFDYISKVMKRRTIVFFLSDFCDSGWESRLSAFANHYDFVGVDIVDPVEKKFPKAGLVLMRDSETNQTMMIDTSKHSIKEKSQEVESLVKKSGGDFLKILTNSDWLESFVEFFHRREEIRRH
ncbi:MAG: DUF58 domain-containing protein [Spirochaetales bacterium]|nr:DUF58 domain-containing protein [Spirochaetales bacterium]